ncbi:hypothetical protein HAX54_001408 [Datura stramonium]|uniref:Uncharacterized protein n=1 Tax=Datura stramonium TaxID=4076 RepID=A0ABS8T341_DATST|nr:hypothetical protein [Datura stramonium]
MTEESEDRPEPGGGAAEDREEWRSNDNRRETQSQLPAVDERKRQLTTRCLEARSDGQRGVGESGADGRRRPRRGDVGHGLVSGGIVDGSGRSAAVVDSGE